MIGKALLAVLGVLLAVTLAACGGERSRPSTDSTPEQRAHPGNRSEYADRLQLR